MGRWQASAHGEPEAVLTWVETGPQPVPGSADLLVEVLACGLNMADVLLCRGTYQEKPDLPFTPGIELAGRVVAAAADSDLAPGALVVGTAALPNGGLATIATMHRHDAFALPAGSDPVAAAASHVTFQTAWYALVRRARLAAGEVVLVHAGAGGTGSAAIQLARHLGARVLATAGGPDKVRVCRDLGAQEAWDHRTTDVRQAVLDATDGRGVDIVYDTVGGASFDQARRLVASEGRLVVIGVGSAPASAPTNHVLVKNYDIVGVHWPLHRRQHPEQALEAHVAISALLAAGSVRPLIDSIRPLGEAPAALADLSSGRTTGKVVLTPTGR